jgi:hypothetical protein
MLGDRKKLELARFPVFLIAVYPKGRSHASMIRYQHIMLSVKQTLIDPSVRHDFKQREAFLLTGVTD